MKIICPVHGGRIVEPIAPVGPTLTRPQLRVIERLPFKPHEKLYDADPSCDHYVTYGLGGGIRCIRCRGWYCA